MSTTSQAFRANEHAKDGKFHLLLAASGSVATIKIPNIIKGLADHQAVSIHIALTRASHEFLQGQSAEQPSLEALGNYANVDGIHLDEHEWSPTWKRDAPILHIELRRWAHALVIAPLSANTLAKIAHGFCNNLLTSVVRAWEVADEEPIDPNVTKGDTMPLPVPSNTPQKPIIVAPAMNTAMWNHPLTAQQLGLLGKGNVMHWIEVLRPIEKTIACGDTGHGAMCEWNVIVDRIVLEKERFGKRT